MERWNNIKLASNNSFFQFTIFHSCFIMLLLFIFHYWKNIFLPNIELLLWQPDNNARHWSRSREKKEKYVRKYWISWINSKHRKYLLFNENHKRNCTYVEFEPIHNILIYCMSMAMAMAHTRAIQTWAHKNHNVTMKPVQIRTLFIPTFCCSQEEAVSVEGWMRAKCVNTKMDDFAQIPTM